MTEVKRLRRENSELTEKLEELLTANQQLRDSNLVLQGKCETLFDDLSVKEAQWSQREEELKAEVHVWLELMYECWNNHVEGSVKEHICICLYCPNCHTPFHIYLLCQVIPSPPLPSLPPPPPLQKSCMKP